MLKNIAILLIITPSIYSCTHIEKVNEFIETVNSLYNYDELDAFYESKEAVKKSTEPHGFNAFQRGWIPKWIPESSRDIKEAHNLDSNAQVLTLRFSTDEDWDVPSICSPTTIYKVESPRIKRPWWPPNLYSGGPVGSDTKSGFIDPY